MKRKTISKRVAALVLTGMFLCGNFGVEVSAATLTKTMTWVGYGVTVTTQTSELGDKNYATVFAYDKNGSCIKSASDDSVSVATAVAVKSGTESAMGVHYAEDSSGTVYGYKKITRDKGTGY